MVKDKVPSPKPPNLTHAANEAAHAHDSRTLHEVNRMRDMDAYKPPAPAPEKSLFQKIPDVVEHASEALTSIIENKKP